HEDEQIDVPSEFKWAPAIEHYAWEHIDALKAVTPRKPLPRMKDILTSLYDVSEADYFIYSNLDIGLYPSFYLEVKALIEQGYDAFCINRRDLPKDYRGIQLDETKSELIFSLEGKPHPGIDCFLFKREILPRLELGNVYVGFPPVGKVLKTQIDKHSQNPTWIKDRHLTFHLGKDALWKASQNAYAEENRQQAQGLFVRPRTGSRYKLKIRLLRWLRKLMRQVERL
ncbi:MAG: hypothetical protein F6J97_25320, partial [Leptolyngbya sp. SIO4C1]|nr:hypothetical protein [Leptolyngbya sp. SIO4C1]